MDCHICHLPIPEGKEKEVQCNSKVYYFHQDCFEQYTDKSYLEEMSRLYAIQKEFANDFIQYQYTLQMASH